MTPRSKGTKAPATRKTDARAHCVASKTAPRCSRECSTCTTSSTYGFNKGVIGRQAARFEPGRTLEAIPSTEYETLDAVLLDGWRVD